MISTSCYWVRASEFFTYFNINLISIINLTYIHSINFSTRTSSYLCLFLSGCCAGYHLVRPSLLARLVHFDCYCSYCNLHRCLHHLLLSPIFFVLALSFLFLFSLACSSFCIIDNIIHHCILFYSLNLPVLFLAFYLPEMPILINNSAFVFGYCFDFEVD